MSRQGGYVPVKPIVLIAVGIMLALGILMSSPGATAKDEGFAIYLTRQDIPPTRMEALSQVDLIDQPIISVADIITYNAKTHELQLTDEAFEHICQLVVPVQGRSFVVCVDRRPVYWGAFWVMWSSMSFDGVAIWLPPMLEASQVIRLELGYPSPSFYEGEDPRNSPEIFKSLEEAGKLIHNLSNTSLEKLPRSFKGYELYSWAEEGQWHFTLITGTNRVKTTEEIVSKQHFLSQAGWVKVQVLGADAIIDVLGRLPEGESVFWCDELHVGDIAGTMIDLELPSAQVVDAIREQAERCGLDFVVLVGS